MMTTVRIWDKEGRRQGMRDILAAMERVPLVDATCAEAARRRFASLIMPQGALGKLQDMVARYCAARAEADPVRLLYPCKALVVFKATAYEDKPLTILARRNGVALYHTTPEDDTFSTGYALGQVLGRRYQLISLGATPQRAYLAGIMIGAARYRSLIMLGGLDSITAAEQAIVLCPQLADYLICSDATTEEGQEEALARLNLSPLLHLGFTGRYGYGAILTFNFFEAGLKAYKQMRTFAEAGVSSGVREYEGCGLRRDEG